VREKIQESEDLIWYYFYEDLDSALSITLDLLVYLKEHQVSELDLIRIKKLHSKVRDQLGQYNKSLSILYRLLDEIDSSRYPQNYANVLYGIGLMNDEQLEDHKVALSFYKRTNIIFDLLDNKSLRPKIYHAMGDAFRFLGEYDSSLYYMEKSAALWENNNDENKEGLVIVYLALCETLCELDKYKQSKFLLNKIYNIQKRQLLSAYAKGYLTMVEGIIFSGLRDYKKAISAFKKAEQYGLEVKYSRGVILIYEELIPTLVASGDFKEAYHYQKKYTDLQEGLLGLEKANAVKTAEVKFDTEKNKKEIIALKQQQQIDALEMGKKNSWIFSLSIGTLFLMAIILLVYRQSKTKAKNFTQLQEKNKKIETLMRELHHRVKNNLQVISSLLGLQSMKMEDSVAKQAIEEGKSRVKAMSMIHQRLYQEDGVSEINFEEYANALIHELKKSYQNSREVKLELNIPKIVFNVDTTLPLGLIINEVITNSFKYAFKGMEEPALKVALMNKGNTYQLLIADNGPGLKKLINLEDASSFGLKLVNILTHQLKGSVRSFNDNGLNYIIEFNV